MEHLLSELIDATCIAALFVYCFILLMIATCIIMGVGNYIFRGNKRKV